MIYQPSALQVSFVGASLLALIQSRLLRNPTLRKWLGITPLYEIESSNAAAVAAAQKSVAKATNATAAAPKKKNNQSSVKNIIATPQYQPPRNKRSVLKGQGRQNAAAAGTAGAASASASASASDVAIPTGRAFSSSPSSPTLDIPVQPQEETKEKANEKETTWLSRTTTAARDSARDSIRSVKKVVGLDGPSPETENMTTNNPVKTRAYLQDADVYEAERQQYFRDMRMKRTQKEKRLEEEEEEEEKGKEVEVEAKKGRKDKGKDKAKVKGNGIAKGNGKEEIGIWG